MAMRKRVLVIERRKFVCTRIKCNSRTFFSQQRYTTHMSLHYIEDGVRMQRINFAKREAAIREGKEEQVSERLSSVRSFVLRALEQDALLHTQRAER